MLLLPEKAWQVLELLDFAYLLQVPMIPVCVGDGIGEPVLDGVTVVVGLVVGVPSTRQRVKCQRDIQWSLTRDPSAYIVA